MYCIYSLVFFIFLCILAYLFGVSPNIYVKRCAISFDQLINTWLFFGYEDETLSSRAFRWSDDVGTEANSQNTGESKLKSNKWHYQKMPAIIINALFFWDYLIDEDGDKVRHCELSFWSERERSQMHPEGR